MHRRPFIAQVLAAVLTPAAIACAAPLRPRVERGPVWYMSKVGDPFDWDVTATPHPASDQLYFVSGRAFWVYRVDGDKAGAWQEIPALPFTLLEPDDAPTILHGPGPRGGDHAHGHRVLRAAAPDVRGPV